MITVILNVTIIVMIIAILKIMMILLLLLLLLWCRKNKIVFEIINDDENDINDFEFNDDDDDKKIIKMNIITMKIMMI